MIKKSILHPLFLLIFFLGGAFQTLWAQTMPASQAKTTEDDFAYYKRHGKTSKNWNDFVKKGFESYDQQDCEKSVSFLKQAAGVGCNDPIVLFKLAACSEFMGSYYSAAQYYKQSEDGLKTLPSPHRYANDFYEAYGRALYLNKKTDEALPYLAKAAEVGTPSFFLYYLLGEIYLGKQQNQPAATYFQKAIEQPQATASTAQLARAYGSVGQSYTEMKDWEKAIQYLDQALKYDPTNADFQNARYKVGELKRQEQLFQMMQDGFQKMPTTKPKGL